MHPRNIHRMRTEPTPTTKEVSLRSVFGKDLTARKNPVQYSLATYMARMERAHSASRPKATLAHLLDAIAYLHGRSMVRTPVRGFLGFRG